MAIYHKLPDLRIVPAESVVLHEETDPDRTTRLTEILRRDQVLKNPPVVAPLPTNGRFVVLDGANRVASLRALAAASLLVQVVEYDEVQLDTWNHLVTGMDEVQLFDTIRTVPGLTLEPATLRQARNRLATRRILGYLINPEGHVYLLRGGEGLRDEARLLNDVVRAYKGMSQIFRLKADSIAELKQYYEGIAALVVFPSFTPADIINLTLVDAKLPTGITRHLIPGRALRLNYEISTLMSDRSLEEQNRKLGEFVHQKLAAREIRFYEESTFLFDE
ncbi:MAG TPA: hypothetical protein DEP84_00870 [Chloroflexi bacterium]|nr:hypothetical protein [Chloroflexota bacterium]